MKKILIIFLFILTLSSCEKEIDNPKDIDDNIIPIDEQDDYPDFVIPMDINQEIQDYILSLTAPVLMYYEEDLAILLAEETLHKIKVGEEAQTFNSYELACNHGIYTLHNPYNETDNTFMLGCGLGVYTVDFTNSSIERMDELIVIEKAFNEGGTLFYGWDPKIVFNNGTIVEYDGYEMLTKREYAHDNRMIIYDENVAVDGHLTDKCKVIVIENGIELANHLFESVCGDIETTYRVSNLVLLKDFSNSSVNLKIATYDGEIYELSVSGADSSDLIVGYYSIQINGEYYDDELEIVNRPNSVESDQILSANENYIFVVDTDNSINVYDRATLELITSLPAKSDQEHYSISYFSEGYTVRYQNLSTYEYFTDIYSDHVLVMEGVEEHLWFTDEFGSYAIDDERYIFDYNDFVVYKLEGYEFEGIYTILRSNDYYFFTLSRENSVNSISFIVLDKSGVVIDEYEILHRLGYPIILDSEGNMFFGDKSSSAGVLFNPYQ